MQQYAHVGTAIVPSKMFPSVETYDEWGEGGVFFREIKLVKEVRVWLGLKY